MARLSGYLCVLVLSLILEVSWGGSSNLRCYTCDATTTKECGDPPVKDKLAVVECKALLNASLPETEGTQLSENPHITDIVLKNTLGKRDVIDDNFNFYCSKVSAKLGPLESLQRGCMVTPKEVTDVCGFIKTGLGPLIELNGCSVCEEDLCNSSSNIVVSCTLVLLGIIGLFVF